MSIKLIASDLDGTMLAHDNSIPESNLKAIESMKKKHIQFAICTGKSYAVSKNICDQCDAHYGIFGNGTQIIDLKQQKEISKQTLTIEEIAKCYNLAQKYNLHIHAYGDNFIITEELKYMDLRNYLTNFYSKNCVFGKYDSEFNLTLTNSNQSGLTFYVVKNLLNYIEKHSLTVFNLVLTSNEMSKTVKTSLEKETNLTIQQISKKGEYIDTVLQKEYEYIYIAPKNIGKGYALNILKDYLNVTTNDVLSIGDNLNDIDLLQSSGIGVAVANAYEPVKDIATYTTKTSANDGGFAEAVYQYIGFE